MKLSIEKINEQEYVLLNLDESSQQDKVLCFEGSYEQIWKYMNSYIQMNGKEVSTALVEIK